MLAGNNNGINIPELSCYAHIFHVLNGSVAYFQRGNFYVKFIKITEYNTQVYIFIITCH
jgi:hypothetical protein